MCVRVPVLLRQRSIWKEPGHKTVPCLSSGEYKSHTVWLLPSDAPLSAPCGQWWTAAPESRARRAGSELKDGPRLFPCISLGRPQQYRPCQDVARDCTVKPLWSLLSGAFIESFLSSTEAAHWTPYFLSSYCDQFDLKVIIQSRWCSMDVRWIDRMTCS